MPPKTRRSQRSAAQTGSQSTLSFKNKVTKSTAPSHNDAKSKPSARLSDAAKEEIVETVTKADPEPVSIGPEAELSSTEPQIEPEPAAAPTPRKKKRVSAASSAGVDPREAQAEHITDAQIQKWWKQVEKERRAPRVHQSDVPTHEKILRHFDLSGQYGSCIGITRLERWKRANGLALEPPLEVLAVLLREAEDSSSKAAGKGKGGKSTAPGRSQGCGELAYIDELVGGRVGVVDV